MNNNRSKRLAMKLLAIIFTIISSLGAMVLWFLTREALLTFLQSISFDIWKVPAIDNFSFVFFGITWLIFVFYIHYLFTKGLKNQNLFIYFLNTSGLQLILLCLCQWIVMIFDMNKVDILSIFARISEIVLGIGLIGLAYFQKNKLRKDMNISP